MPWLGLSLEVDAAAAEAFSDALLDAGAQSVALEAMDAPRRRLDALLAADADAAALVRQASESAGLASLPRFTTAPVADQDWVRSARAQFVPVEIGARLWIGPTWHRPPAGRITLQIDPGLAFGTGTHPTTRLVLRFLDKAVRGGESVLDYGCGSGILAIAAAKLGAAHVAGVDVDPQAVETAAANARANRVALQAGLPEVLAAATYDIVVSNILAQPLIVLAPLLAARSAARGRIALAGILESQATEVMAAYDAFFEMELSDIDDVWVLLEGRRK